MNGDMGERHRRPADGQDGLPRRRKATAAGELPTLQRNALCRMFGCPEFSPAEVAALGYRRLQRADGIGRRGLAAIVEWLAGHGLALDKPELAPPLAQQQKSRREIELAVRLLRAHGYIVQASAGETAESA